MAVLGENLWAYNLRRVLVVDVSDDYRAFQAPLPTECYPVLAEVWVPTFHLPNRVSDLQLVDGYLYDWHETPTGEDGTWVIGVVNRDIVSATNSFYSGEPRVKKSSIPTY